jgi:pimeloyl-ACP methyl ester carboxylesterase
MTTARQMMMGAALILVTVLGLDVRSACAETTEDLNIRGQQQLLHLYGQRGGDPVLVTSGDGGWIHLGVHVAEALAARGYFVVGFDARAYLRSFTTSEATLRPEDVPADYRVLIEHASQRGSGRKPILIGVSEGAGLSVLAAADSATKGVVAGVIGLGLPDANELGWRLKDSLIYLTHGVPKEPSFSSAAVVSRLTPIPLAEIHSSRDEYVPVGEARRILEKANAPKTLWVVSASNHRFSDNLGEFDQRLLEAISWVKQNAPQ